MPQCPICNAAVWVGQRYCTTCDHPLPHGKEEDYFCPKCGIRMDSPREICQGCNITPPKITGAPSIVATKTRRFPLKLPGIFIGAGLISVALLLLFLFNKSSGPPQPVVMPPSQTVSEPTPTAPPIPAAETAPPAPTVAAVQEPVVPSVTAAASPPELTTPTPSLPRYFVNIDDLSVRDGPSMTAPRIAILNFKDEVELLDTSGGWGRIRNVRRQIIGWSYMRYLQPVAAGSPQALSQLRPSSPKEPEPISSEASEGM